MREQVLIWPAASMPGALRHPHVHQHDVGHRAPAAFSTASAPSEASPTSSRSGSCCRTISRPRRNSAWSSTTITRSRSAPSASPFVPRPSPALPHRMPVPPPYRQRPGAGERILALPCGTTPAALAVMIAELPLELARRRGRAPWARRRPRRAARNVLRGMCSGRLDALGAVELRVVLGDELEVDPRGPRLHAARGARACARPSRGSRR